MELSRLIEQQGRLSPEHAVGWSYRLARTLRRLHQRGFVHGRLSAAALQVDGPEPFLAGKLLDPNPLQADPQYASVPRADGAPPSEADDVWAVGVLLYHAVAGKPPFVGSSHADVKARIEWLPASPIAEHGCEAPAIQDLLDRVLVRDREDRITTARELREALLACAGPQGKLPPLEISDRMIVELATATEQSSTDVIADWLMEENGADEIVDEPSHDSAYDLPSAAQLAAMGVAAAKERAAQAQDGPQSSEGLPAELADAGAELARHQTPPARAAGPRIALMAAAAVAVLVALFFVLRSGDEPAPPARSTKPNQPGATMPSVAATPSTPGPARPAAARPSAAAAASTKATTAAAKPSSPEQIQTCVVSLLPEDTFATREPGFDFLCTETEPTEGALALRSRIVWAGKGGLLTEGMREWSQLSWYDMGAFAIVQKRCCASPPELKSDKITPALAFCPLDEALDELVDQALGDDSSAMEAAIQGYTKAVKCIYHAGAAKQFGHAGALTGGEITFFRRLLDRVRESR